MKTLLALLLLVTFSPPIQAEGDEPDLAVSPKRSSRPVKKKPETQATAEVKKTVPRKKPTPETQPVPKKRPSLIQINRDAKKIVTPKIQFLKGVSLSPIAKKLLKQMAQWRVGWRPAGYKPWVKGTPHCSMKVALPWPRPKIDGWNSSLRERSPLQWPSRHNRKRRRS